MVVGARKQVHDHFRISFRGENRALCAQPGAQFVRVFDDSVVDKREASIGADVGVGVCNRGTSVSCPTGMPDPGVSIGWCLRIYGLAQVDQLADGLDDVQFSRIRQCDSCRIISAVFQAREAIEDDLTAALRGLICDVSNNSTHSLIAAQESCRRLPGSYVAPVNPA